ncbi:MAG: YihY/virulence factor BrkB family protein [Acidobacteriaceae bacterium]
MGEKQMLERLMQGWQQVKTRLVQFDDLANGLPGVLARAIKETFKPESATTCAAIAYFSLFSLFPLILLSIFVASYRLIPSLDQQFIISRIEFIAPALGQLLGKNINTIIRERGPITVVAMAGLIWSASNVFNMLHRTLYRIWEGRRPRPALLQRALAILLVLAIIGPALVGASIASSIFGSIQIALPAQVMPLADVASLVLAIFLDISFFLLLYLLFPHGKSGLREILPGALLAGILWEIAKKAFLVFVSSYLSTSNLVYGSLAAVIAFLTWAYLSGLILLFGAYLSLFYFRMRHNPEAGVKPQG